MILLDTWATRVLADPLATARAAPRAIGTVGFDIPDDLLLGTGGAVTHLPWDADLATPFADRWVESSFAPWTRSILEQWAAGAFDFIEAVVFSRGDDSAQRLYYYISELQRRGLLRGPHPLILDVARIPRASSVAKSIDAVRAVADALGIDAARLATGIALANNQRRSLAGLSEGRHGPGAPFERVARASLFAPLPDAPAIASLPEPSLRRVLLAGTAPPDDRLHRAVEAAGWTVAGEAHERGLDRMGAEISSDEDPFIAVGTRLHESRFGPRSFADPAAALVSAAKRVKADAVILWLIEQEESIVWHVPPQCAALAQADLPALVMTRRAWSAADGAVEEIGAWLTGLGR